MAYNKQYYDDKYSEYTTKQNALLREKADIEMYVHNQQIDYEAAQRSAESYKRQVDKLYDTDTSNFTKEELEKHEEKIYKYEEKQRQAEEKALDIFYAKNEDGYSLNNADTKLYELQQELDKNDAEIRAVAAEEQALQEADKGPLGETADSLNSDANQTDVKAETDNAATEIAQPTEGGAQSGDAQETSNNSGSTQQSASSNASAYNNFKIPIWNYKGYAQELQLFRKGKTSITGDPGWFYFKILFHFDDKYGLLGNAFYNIGEDEYTTGNTAIQYLESRQDLFKADNLKSKAKALRKFVSSLSFINQNAPWFFDKVSGLDQVVPLLNDFSKERKISISCLPDAVDMRLTTLLHLYQYACYDDINMKEIIPENLRKFNMSIILYHIPLQRYSNVLNVNGQTFSAKGINGSNPSDFSNNMSFKLYTFKGCQIDLSSIGSVVPGTVDNAQPFNLGQNTISITYDRAFTHLMNEWEQFMVGSDGFYYDAATKINSNATNKFQERLNALKSVGTASNLRILDSLITKGATVYTEQGQLLGNIYGYDIRAIKQSIIAQNSDRIYLNNLFGDVHYYKGLALSRSVAPGTRVQYREHTFTGAGVRIFANEDQLQQYFWGTKSRIYNIGNTEMANNYINLFETLKGEYNNKSRIYFSSNYVGSYENSLNGIVNQYKNAWKNLKGAFKSQVNTVKNTFKGIGNMFKL